MKTLARTLALALLCATLPTPLDALAAINLRDARLTEIEAGDDLSGQLDRLIKRQDEPAWIGYTVPAVAGFRAGCGDMDDDDCFCRLERQRGNYWSTHNKDEYPAVDMIILLRVADRRVDRMRLFTENCVFDCDDLEFAHITNVDPGQSVAWLADLVRQEADERHPDKELAQAAVGAIARHDHPDVFRTLTIFIEPPMPTPVRESGVFWIGESGERDAVPLLRSVRKSDPSEEVREQVIFAFHVNGTPEAHDELADIARNDSDAEAREKALFWLSQDGGPEALAIITDAIESDRDRDVRVQAVFALSQIDSKDATDHLVEVARNNSSSEVREQAVFWLGQKAGKKAADALIDFIENDPDAGVKEQAVFALSQLPKDEGIPHLIRVAKTSRNKRVREQAIFWLSQSGDDRAIDFFEEILDP